jgi:hypothetical protein
MPLEPHPTDPNKLIMRAGNYNLPVQAEYDKAATVQEPVIFYRCKGCDHAYEGIPPSSCDCMEKTEFTRVEYFTTCQCRSATHD